MKARIWLDGDLPVRGGGQEIEDVKRLVIETARGKFMLFEKLRESKGMLVVEGASVLGLSILPVSETCIMLAEY